MSTIRELKQRRFVQILLGYLAAGWVIIEAFDQLTQNNIIPGLAYRLALIWFLVGIPAAGIVAWFHGEQGRQKVPKSEIALLALIALGLVGFTARTVDGHLEEERAKVGAVEAGLATNRIAVLYFTDRTNDGELGSLADAFTEDLIRELSRVPDLDVVSANGVRPYRGEEDPDVVALADTLKAGTVVEGTVGKSKDGVAVDLALVDGGSGAVFRRASLEVPLPTYVEGGTRLAREAARMLRERLGEEVTLRETRSETDNTAAWSLLQQGKRAMKDAEDALDADNTDRADVLYQKADSLLAGAARLDTAWARPMALRSEVAYKRARIPAELAAGLPQTLAAIRYGDEAVARDPTDAGGLEARGTARYWRWLTDPELEGAARNQLITSAKQDLEAAVQRDPHRASAFATLSHLYYNDPSAPGLTAVLMAAQRAYEEDAFLSSAANVLWRIHTAALDIGQFPPAVKACDEGLQRFPGDYRFRICGIRLMASPAIAADADSAWHLAAEADSLMPESERPFYDVENRIFIAAVLQRAGRTDSARAVLDRVAATADDPRIDPHRDLWLREAIVRSRLGDTHDAVALVRKYLVANPGHHFDQKDGLSWWWRDLEPVPAFQQLLALQATDDR